MQRDCRDVIYGAVWVDWEFVAVRKCVCVCRMQWLTSKLNDWETTGNHQRREQSCHYCKTRKYRYSVSVSSYGDNKLSYVLWINMYRFE